MDINNKTIDLLKQVLFKFNTHNAVDVFVFVFVKVISLIFHTSIRYSWKHYLHHKTDLIIGSDHKFVIMYLITMF